MPAADGDKLMLESSELELRRKGFLGAGALMPDRRVSGLVRTAFKALRLPD